jgi:hypothetical protein
MKTRSLVRERLAGWENHGANGRKPRYSTCSWTLMPLSYLPNTCQNHGNDEGPAVSFKDFQQSQAPNWHTICPSWGWGQEANFEDSLQSDAYDQDNSKLEQVVVDEKHEIGNAVLLGS